MDNLVVCVQNDNKIVSPKETIDAIYKAGFKNVFVQYYHRQNMEFDELTQIDYCRKLGLNIVFCHLGYTNINEMWVEGEFGEEVTEQYIKDLDLMKEKQIELVIMHLTTHKEFPMYNETGLKRFRRIADYAKKIGVKIAFENTRKQGYLEYVLCNIKNDNIGVCFDAGHYHVHFNDVFDFEFFKNRFFAVHLHDNDKSLDQHLLPFDGTIDWEDTLSKIKSTGYDGAITLELCYRGDYLNQSVEDFYKEGYKRGKKLEEIFASVPSNKFDTEMVIK